MSTYFQLFSAAFTQLVYILTYIKYQSI